MLSEFCEQITIILKAKEQQRVETKSLHLIRLLVLPSAGREMVEPMGSISPVFKWKVSIKIDDTILRQSRRQVIAEGQMEHARQSALRA